MFQNPFPIKVLISPESAWFTDWFSTFEIKKITYRKKLWRFLIPEFNLWIALKPTDGQYQELNELWDSPETKFRRPSAFKPSHFRPAPIESTSISLVYNINWRHLYWFYQEDQHLISYYEILYHKLWIVLPVESRKKLIISL